MEPIFNGTVSYGEFDHTKMAPVVDAIKLFLEEILIYPK